VDLGLKGKGAIVTGGALGIGAAIAIELAREGANVAVVDWSDGQEVKAVVADIEKLGSRSMALQADVSSYNDAQRIVGQVVQEFGSLDILVCNAGITQDGVIWKMTEEQWDNVISVNLKGYFNYNQAAARHFRDHKYGKIVNISSINGLRGKFGQANYTAAKGGGIALTKTLAKELGMFNINVNCVAPGMVMTDMMKAVPMEFQRAALDETAVGRFASPEDVAHAVAFLCSDLSRHVTGEVIKVDGGQYI